MKKRITLQQSFFNRSVLKVAPDLLGKYLVRKIGRREYAYCITEVEAYDGCDDRACHASRGRTARTETMFGEAGRFYIYLVYGMYYMLNVVTDKKEYPAAVLLRGLESIIGPGKLTKKLSIDKSLNGKPAAKTTGLWFEDRGIKVGKKDVKKTARIGVEYAGPLWAKKHYRFVLKNKKRADGRKANPLICTEMLRDQDRRDTLVGAVCSRSTGYRCIL
jgi:DNA-3-methyladenine glycosylase